MLLTSKCWVTYRHAVTKQGATPGHLLPISEVSGHQEKWWPVVNNRRTYMHRSIGPTKAWWETWYFQKSLSSLPLVNCFFVPWVPSFDPHSQT